MTVGKLIKELQALPQDMEIKVAGDDGQHFVDIHEVSRGSWPDEVGDKVIENAMPWNLMKVDDPEIIQDDENGTVAVLLTW
jgi:hypothetical protein